MTNKQFHFCVITGAMLLALGGAVMSQTSTGVGLIGLGLAIISLSVWGRMGGSRGVPLRLQRLSVAGAGNTGRTALQNADGSDD